MLKKEARLFDAKEFIIKTFLAVLIGYILGNSVEYLNKDMISLLFGMMLTLEPVNITGIRNGFEQIKASFIGAIVTGVIVSFLGINPLTTAISVACTVYVCILINWKQMSVVAVFTSIYMTQYVQIDSLGNPSQLLTLKLRLSALLTGVLKSILVY